MWFGTGGGKNVRLSRTIISTTCIVWNFSMSCRISQKKLFFFQNNDDFTFKLKFSQYRFFFLIFNTMS